MASSHDRDGATEWLDLGQRPGRLARLTARFRGPRWWLPVAGAAVLVAFAFGGSPSLTDPFATPTSDRPPAPTTETDARITGPMPRARTVGGWEIVGEESVFGGTVGYSSTFFAINRDPQPQTPDNLRVVARFLDAPGQRLRAVCVGTRLTMAGALPLEGPVEPGESVFVGCDDPTVYPSDVPRVDRRSVRIIALP